MFVQNEWAMPFPNGDNYTFSHTYVFSRSQYWQNTPFSTTQDTNIVGGGDST